MSTGTGKYPLGAVKLYGPTDKQATKLIAAVYPGQGREPSAMRVWNSMAGDIRDNERVRDELADFLKESAVAHAVVTEEVVGCAHEEGIDYPAGGACPFCALWATRPGARMKNRTAQTPGRNDPCHCGSGKKYKKCCGATL